VGTVDEWKPSCDQLLALMYTHPEAFSLRHTQLDKRVTEDLLRSTFRESPDDEDKLMQLADYLVKQDRKKEAEAIFRGLLAQSIGKRGIYHVQTLSCLGDMCNSFKISDPKKAEPLLRAVLRGQQEALGLDDSITSIAAHRLGEILFHQGKYVESEDALGKALIYLKRVPVEQRITDIRANPVFNLLLKIKLELSDQAKRRGDEATCIAKLTEGNKLMEEMPIQAT
jgi:tetratricopeptide (TPR) repeat protein